MTHPTLHAPSNPSGSLQSTSTMGLIKATLLPWPASCQSTLKQTFLSPDQALC